MYEAAIHKSLQRAINRDAIHKRGSFFFNSCVGEGTARAGKDLKYLFPTGSNAEPGRF